jgi:hypothetical protein
MTSTQTRLSWAAVGMVVSYNLFCWLPASIWAFIIAASAGLTFLFAARSVWFGSAMATLSFVSGMITASLLPTGYSLYFAGFWAVLVFLPAAFMSGSIRRGFSAYKAQILALLPASMLMMLYLANLGNVATDWKDVLGNMSTLVIDWYREAMKALPSSLSPEEVNMFKAFVESLFDLFHRFFAGLVICWAAAMNIAAYYFAGMMIRKEGGFCRELRDFVLWKLGVHSMILLAFALVFWVIGIKGTMPFADNLLFILGVSYMVVGLAVIEYYLKRRRIHAALRIAFYVILFLSGWVGGLLAAVLGLVDSHFDFRRVRAQQIG